MCLVVSFGAHAVIVSIVVVDFSLFTDATQCKIQRYCSSNTEPIATSVPNVQYFGKWKMKQLKLENEIKKKVSRKWEKFYCSFLRIFTVVRVEKYKGSKQERKKQSNL